MKQKTISIKTAARIGVAIQQDQTITIQQVDTFITNAEIQCFFFIFLMTYINIFKPEEYPHILPEKYFRVGIF